MSACLCMTRKKRKGLSRWRKLQACLQTEKNWQSSGNRKYERRELIEEALRADERFVPVLKRKNLLGDRGGVVWIKQHFIIRDKKENEWRWDFLGRKEDIWVRWPQFSQKRSEKVEVWMKKLESRKCLAQKIKWKGLKWLSRSDSRMKRNGHDV